MKSIRREPLGVTIMPFTLQRLFLPSVGLRGPVLHLYQEFVKALGNEYAITVARKAHDTGTLDDAKFRQLVGSIKEDGQAVTILKNAREAGTLHPQQVAQLVRCIDYDLSPDNCRSWLRPLSANNDDLPCWHPLAAFIRQPMWSEDDNARHLAVHRAGGYLQLFRPASVRVHMLHIETANAEFAWSLCKRWAERLDLKGKALLVTNLFAEHVPLSELLTDQKRSRGRPEFRLDGSEKTAFKETRPLHGVELAEMLTELLPDKGRRLFDGLTPTEFCTKDGDRFNDRIRELRRKAGIRPRKYHRRS